MAVTCHPPGRHLVVPPPPPTGPRSGRPPNSQANGPASAGRCNRARRERRPHATCAPHGASILLRRDRSPALNSTRGCAANASTMWLTPHVRLAAPHPRRHRDHFPRPGRPPAQPITQRKPTTQTPSRRVVSPGSPKAARDHRPPAGAHKSGEPFAPFRNTSVGPNFPPKPLPANHHSPLPPNRSKLSPETATGNPSPPHNFLKPHPRKQTAQPFPINACTHESCR